MAKKEEQKPTAPQAPIALKTIKLSSAETSFIQGLNAQKQELDKQIMVAVQSILDTRDVSQTDIVGGLSFSEDIKTITFNVKTGAVSQPQSVTETTGDSF